MIKAGKGVTPTPMQLADAFAHLCASGSEAHTLEEAVEATLAEIKKRKKARRRSALLV